MPYYFYYISALLLVLCNFKVRKIIAPDLPKSNNAKSQHLGSRIASENYDTAGDTIDVSTK
jgi:p-aminobenzoyl-glutamate transporter AbgT